MSKAQTLSRTSLRRDQILEVHFAPLPEPPPEMLKLPGVSQWWERMKLSRERDVQALHSLINNLQISANSPLS